jgi:hypothetical protein
MPSKSFPNWEFGLENKPSGNPDAYVCQLCKTSWSKPHQISATQWNWMKVVFYFSKQFNDFNVEKTWCWISISLYSITF